jgi:hypothetical protein
MFTHSENLHNFKEQCRFARKSVTQLPLYATAIDMLVNEQYPQYAVFKYVLH